MSISAIKSHPLGTTISQILTLKNEKAFSDPDANFTSDQTWMIERIFAITHRAQQLLNDTPAILISLAGITNLNSHFTQVLNETQAFVNNRNIGHIQNASAAIDAGILPSMWAFAPTRDRAGQALGKTFSDISAKSSAAVDILAERSRTTSDTLESLKGDIDSYKAKLSEISEVMETQRKANLEISTEFRTSYAELERDLRQKFSEEQSTFSSAFEDSLKQAQEKIVVYDKQNVENSSRMVSEIGKHEQDAKRILQIVGNIGVTGNYQNIANQEDSQAKFWRWATIAFFVLGVLAAATSFGIFIYHEFTGTTSTDSIWTFSMRFVTAIAIAAPAFYTARESARHRTNSDRARQKELELASLGPFIESLPESARNTLKEKLTERYFGNQIDDHDIKQPLDLDGIIKLIQSLTTSGAR